jgi:hypothetical protein
VTIPTKVTNHLTKKRPAKFTLSFPIDEQQIQVMLSRFMEKLNVMCGTPPGLVFLGQSLVDIWLTGVQLT